MCVGKAGRSYARHIRTHATANRHAYTTRAASPAVESKLSPESRPNQGEARGQRGASRGNVGRLGIELLVGRGAIAKQCVRKMLKAMHPWVEPEAKDGLRSVGRSQTCFLWGFG